MSTEKTTFIEEKDPSVRAGNAMLQGKLEPFIEALENGANPKSCFHGMSLLTWAYLRKVDPAFKKLLLKKGATPNDPDGNFWHFMLFHGRYGDLKTLLKKYAYQETLNNKNQNPLEWALCEARISAWSEKHFRCAELFLQKGASWTIQGGRSTLLHALAQRYQTVRPKKGALLPAWASMLVENGLDINFHYHDQETSTPPLIHLKTPLNPLFLLSLGADPTLPSYNAQPLIHRAVQENNLSLFEKLLERGESLLREDHLGKTPLEYLSTLPHLRQKWDAWLSMYEKEKLNQALISASSPRSIHRL